MATLYSSIVVVSVITAVCWLLVRCLGERRLGLQDSILRACCMLVLTAPLFCLIYNSSYKLSIPILRANNPDTNVSVLHKADAFSGSTETNNTSIAIVDQMPVDARQAISFKSDNEPTIAKSSNSGVAATYSASRAWLLNNAGATLTIFWSVGTAIAFIQILRAYLKSALIRRDSFVLDNSAWHDAFAAAVAIVGIGGKKVQLRWSTQIASPVLIGFRAPTILIPTELLDGQMTSEACEHILTHDLIHIQRGDMISNWLLQLAVAVWWWHPLVHWLKARTSLTRELICDGTTSHYQNAEYYAETLLRLVVPKKQQLSVGLGVAGGSRDLVQRVSWILARPELKQLQCMSRATSRTVLLVICMMSLLASVLQLTPAVAQEANKPEKESITTNETPVTSKQVQAEEDPTEESLPKLPPFISGPQVHGQIVMPDGRPAADAMVYMICMPPKSNEWPIKPLAEATNADGRFTFSNVTAGRYTLWAEATGLVSNFNLLRGHRLDVREQPAEVDAIRLKLHQASTLRFKVVDAETRAPIADASIRPFPAGVIRSRASAQNGEAVFDSVTADNLNFDVYKEGYAHSYSSAAKQPLGSTGEITVELAKGGTLRGKLVDEEGQPVGNCGLMLYPTLGNYAMDLPRTISKPDGTFQLDDLPCETSYRIAADIETHDVAMVEFSISKKEGSAFLEILTPKRKQGIAARFHVSDSEGQAIQGANLLNTGNPSNRKRSGVTDAQGDGQLLDMFLNGVDKADDIHVVVSAHGYADSKVLVPQSSTIEEAPIKVKLRKETGFTAKVITPDGKPMEGVYIVASHPGSPHENSKEIRTNKEGIFIVPGTSNLIMLSVMPPKPYLPLHEQIFKIRPKDPSPREIKLEYGGGIRVQAVDAQSGEELRRYKVKIGHAELKDDDPRNPGGGILSEQANGIDIVGGLPKFEMNNCKIGYPYLVTVSADGYADSKLPRVLCVKSDEAPLTIVKMTKTKPSDFTSVTGTLRDETGPIQNAKVRLVSSSKPDVVTSWYSLKTDTFKDQTPCTQFYQTTSDNQGRFKFEKVLRSQEVIEMYYSHPAGDQRFGDLKIDTTAANTNFDLVAQPRASFTLRVDPEHYPDAREVSISANPQMPGETYQPIPFDYEYIPIEKFTGEDGYRMKLPPGTYQVSLLAKAVRNEDIPNGLTKKHLFSRKIVLTAEAPSLRLDL